MNTYYTIKDTGEAGDYYMVKNSTEAQTWWVKAKEDRDIPCSRRSLKPVRFFAAKKAAINAFNKRCDLYEDFRDGIGNISVVEIIEDCGIIKSIREVSV